MQSAPAPGPKSRALCDLCPRRCNVAEGRYGICRARRCEGGAVIDANYGCITSLALDPIEKKPLRLFHPGSMILSAGSFGCNLKCPFCQNHEISMAGPDFPSRKVAPPDLVELAKSLEVQGNIGIAFTYNEPLVGYEFVLDTCRLAKEAGLATVLVTNGTLLEEPLLKLLPFVDAANVDLKAFNAAFYKWIKGDLECVKRFIELAAPRIHLEVTTLVIPSRNDSDDEMDAEAAWLASLSPEIPLHISRFFPRYKCSDLEPTPIDTILRLAAIASRHLKHVFPGNI
ncbi:MAG: AmmeMemoRadiSam system radical SAM enzyme [Succinivibrio sp.]